LKSGLTGFPHDLRLGRLGVGSETAIGVTIGFSFILLVRISFPIANLRHVLAVLVDVVLSMGKRSIFPTLPGLQIA
jgi:hypothetical protein